MPYVEYTAKRSIISGHTSGNNYQIEFEAERIDPKSNKNTKKNESLSGATEVVFYSINKSWSMTTIPLPESDKAEWDEFLDSVAGGEDFVLSPYGTVAVPGTIYTVFIDGNYNTSRVGTERYFTFSFDARVR